MIVRITLPLLYLLLLAACADDLPRHTDDAARTIAVSASRHGLAPDIKTLLRGDGWLLAQYQPDTVTGAAPELAKRARYRLQLTSSRVGACAAQAQYAYQIKLIENASGKPAVSLKGIACASQAVDRLQRTLRREKLVPNVD